MTGDFLLDQFQLIHPEQGIFRIGQYTPVSIRDQIVRSCYLVERLWTTGRLRPESKLLIIGAGAAGVTAAFRAVAHGVRHVQISDQSDAPLSLQAHCTTRLVDPVQYDWPAGYWDLKCWPIAGPSGFAHGTASAIKPPVLLQADLAFNWAIQFERALYALESNGRATFYPQLKAIDWYAAPAGCYQVEFDDAITGASAGSLDADLIIFAGGFGQESVSVPVTGQPSTRHSGLPFWSDDTFEKQNFGLPAVPHGVLVSGAGDGALQDFIRLVTGLKSARDVWKVVEPCLLDYNARRQLETLWHWEELAYRSDAFAPEYSSRCDTLAKLHARYQSMVDRAIVNGAYWKSIIAALDGVIVPPRPTNKIFLATKAAHFDGCYPLNRLVALVCIAYIKHKYPKHNPVLDQRAVKSVKPVAPGVKWGAIDVEFALSTSCATTVKEIEAWTGPTTTAGFDGLVIRHGIDTATLSIKTSRLSLQPVPAHLP
jgi:hypothetical protein